MLCLLIFEASNPVRFQDCFLFNIVRHKHFDMLYMVQNDIHAPATTVYEALEFSAQMRVHDLDKQKLTDFVDQVELPSSTCASHLWLLLAAVPGCICATRDNHCM